MHSLYDQLLADVLASCHRHYGPRLRAVAVFGSVGRGTPRHDSDIDLLIVADGLPDGRLTRADDFRQIEAAVTPRLRELKMAGFDASLSPVFKTPSEIDLGSPLLLDMTEDARILHDRDGYLARVLDRLTRKLAALGARRIWRGNAWIWDLKPDYRPGEVFEL